MVDSEITGNTTNYWGGGLYNASGVVTLNRVTIAGNHAGNDGGGIYSFGVGAVMQLTNVTVSGNSSSASGGGIYTNRSITVTNCTISDNTSASGGAGIHAQSPASANLRNTIVAANNGSDLRGSFGSLGNNLIGDIGTATGLTNGVNGDRVGSSGSPINPLLAPLADNGGPTRTHALLAGSPAINAGTATGAPTTDQRGVSRVGATDIGSYEFDCNTLVVDTTADVADGNTSSVAALLANKGLDGKISLREAIIATNNTANLASPDRIHFAIAGAGPHTITVSAGGLPDITDAVFIDGTTEPDFSGTPVVELNGTFAGASTDGLVFTATADGSTVEGLVINRFGRHGIQLQAGADGIVLRGNFVGVDPTGTIALGNGDTGIEILSSNNIVGGAGPGEGNVLAGNVYAGVTMHGASADNNRILGNFIGTDRSATLNMGNIGRGVVVWDGAGGNQIGGALPGEGNYITGSAIGIIIDDMFVSGYASILGNRIYGNSVIGIDLDNEGVTPNDPGDGDGGPNWRQNYPVLASAVTSGGNTTITGTLNSTAWTSFRIEFFSSPTGSATGHGEGRTYLGATNVCDKRLWKCEFQHNADRRDRHGRPHRHGHRNGRSGWRQLREHVRVRRQCGRDLRQYPTVCRQ